MKVIFLIEHAHGGVIPFKHRNILDKYKLTYEYWDIRSLKGGAHANDPISIANGDVLIRKLKKENIEDAISNEKNVVFIAGHQITRRNHFFYKLLKKYNQEYIVIINVHHFFNVHNNWIDTIFNTKKGFVAFLFQNIYQPLFNSWNKLGLGIKKPYLAILGSKYDRPFYNFPTPKDGITYCYTRGYEKIKEQSEGVIVKDENKIVFLDQYLPYHFETQHYSKWTMKPETYYPKIENFLKQLEKHTGKKALITTHPRAERGVLEKYVRDIPLIYGGSYQEVATSSLVIAHMTTAIDYCVDLNKPLLIVDCTELENSPAHTATKLYAKELNKKIFRITNTELNSSDLTRIEELSRVDELSYKSYFENNLKSPTAPDMSYWEYIAQHVSNQVTNNK